MATADPIKKNTLDQALSTSKDVNPNVSGDVASLLKSYLPQENDQSKNTKPKVKKPKSRAASVKAKRKAQQEGSPHNIPLTTEELLRIRREIIDQNQFRRRVDRWWDYYDGNQINAEVLQRLKDLGVPISIEPLCHVAIDSVLGIEVKTRTDFVALADTPGEEQDQIAKALSEKMKSMESLSGADEAASEGFKHITVGGFGFAGIYPNPDPFKFPFTVDPTPRNEVWWDMSNPFDRTLQKAKWMLREKWINVEDSKEQLEEHLGIRLEDLGYQRFGASMLDEQSDFSGIELSGVWPEIGRGYAVEEKELFDSQSNKLLITEILYRRWAKTKLIKTVGGRVYEEGTVPKGVDLTGAEHFEAVTSRVRQAFAVGDRIISDGFSPLFRDDFHYAPFLGFIEDRTGTPYGLTKFMTYLQDEVNSRSSKMQFLLSSMRTIRPDGMFIEEDDVFRDEVGRSDADLIFDPEFVEQYPVSAGLMSIDFLKEVEEEQYKRLKDAREALFASIGLTPGWLGQTTGNQESATGYQQMIEQANQTLVKIFDYYNIARKNLGRLLLQLCADSIPENEQVIVPDAIGRKEQIVLNEVTQDDHRSNDVQMYTYQVKLADVPTTPTFRAQQVTQLTEVVKSAPEDFQHLFFPHIFANQQIPNATELAQQAAEIAERKSGGNVEQRIEEAVKRDRMERNFELEMAKLELERDKLALEVRKVDIDEAEGVAKIEKTEAEAGKISSETIGQDLENQFTPISTAERIVANPNIVPIADELHKSAGGEDLNAAPVFIQPGAQSEYQSIQEQDQTTPPLQANTSPAFPPRTSGQRRVNEVVSEPENAEKPEGAQTSVQAGGSPNEGVESGQ